MLVVLDTNIFLTDLRLQSINFENLFSFLRRTQSKIVLPRLVREEIVATYRRNLEEAIQKVELAWKPYSKLTLSERPDFYPVDASVEARELRKRLRNPPKGISIETVLKMDGVDLTEVFLRGIHRVPPANQKGEELRDVILWLFVLHLSKSREEAVAFISQDSGFWDVKDRDRPAFEILRDISERKVQVHLYHSINEFIVSNSLESEPVDEKWVLGVVDEGDLSAMLTSALKLQLGKRSEGYRSVSFADGNNEITSRKLLSGFLYKVDDTTKFAEVDFELECLNVKRSWRPNFQQNSAFGFHGNVNQQAFGLTGLYQFQEPMYSFSNLYGSKENSETEIDETTYRIVAKATLFLRIKEMEITEKEIHKVVILKSEYLSTKSVSMREGD